MKGAFRTSNASREMISVVMVLMLTFWAHRASALDLAKVGALLV